MTLDTTMNKQRTPFAQHRDVTMQVGAISHLFNRTGGGVKLVVPQLLRSTRQVIAMIQIASLLISQSNSKDRPQLEIWFILGVRRLRKGGHGHEPVLAAIGNVRSNQKISYFFLIAPF